MHGHLVLVNGHEVSDGDATLERRRRMWNYWNSYGDESNLHFHEGCRPSYDCFFGYGNCLEIEITRAVSHEGKPLLF